ncbi:MAG: hypothetical protein IOD12_16995 [Silvanigrellales bacterium]|nr:hypothetical protein [Silvanigrellales bacterium]
MKFWKTLPVFLLPLTLCLFACRTRSTLESPKDASSVQSTSANRTYACTPEEAQGQALAKVMTVPAGTTFGYHWTNDERVATPSGLAEWMREKFEAARSTPLQESGNAFGEGLYLASNPISTAGLGRLLVIVPLKPGCVFAVAPDIDWENSSDTRAAIESPHAGLLYPFDAEERAVVLRDASTFDAAALRVVDSRVREGERIESYAARNFTAASPWMEAANYYGAEFAFVASEIVQDKASGAPLLDAQGKLTAEGFALALQSELTSGGSKREQALDSLIAAAPTRLDFPVCGRREERFTYRGSKYRDCVGALFESVAVHVAPSLASSMGESPMGVEEAQKVLGALGYADVLPASTEAQKVFYSQFFERWKAVRGKATAAEALVKASLLFGRDEAVQVFEDWR